ncbi:MAG: tetratricopeptide repeat protein [Candidatus Omnitrophica bacterium]|nr:tetratricopeptide repeat protein [Candidatus Omnitrophota bacterium]
MDRFYFRLSTKVVIVMAALLLLFGASSAVAEMVEDVQVESRPDGFEISVELLFPLIYQSHNPLEPSREVRIELIPTNKMSLTPEQLDELRQRQQLFWDHTTGIPLAEIIFEGGDPETPSITITFTEEVAFTIKSSVDLRSLIVDIQTFGVPEPIPVTVEEAIEDVIPEDEGLAAMMQEAKKEMTDQNYSRAVQMYTKILRDAEGPVRQQAQEFLGLARERNGQLAHAKREYEMYLENYPQGPDADRVRQRLTGLVTATKAPKAPLTSTKAPRVLGLEKKLDKWDTRFYGSYSLFYFRDQTIPEGGDTQINREDLTHDLNFNSRFRNSHYDMRFQFTGSYENNFLDGQEDEDTISSLAFAMRHIDNGLSGKIGRQSRTSGGVLGRFDGIHAAYDVNPAVTLNTVFGYPVESSRDTFLNTDKRFYGFSVDLGTYREVWDFVLFFIDQQNQGVTDRRAVGGEIRYFDPQKSFFSLIDYDTFYNVLNIFLANGRISFPTKTVLNVILDYRRSPILTTNNAIQGQGVNKLDELFNSFTEDQLNQLAEDRTSISKSLTVSVTQDLKEGVQVVGEVSASELEGTIASGGVEAVPGTGVDLFYSLQLILTSLFYENDAVITGVRFSDTQSSYTSTFTLRGRFPYKRKLRFIPKFRVDYRDEKNSSDKRLTLRPVMRIDYQFKKWLRFETEAGFEYRDEDSAGISTSSTETFVLAGFRINF